MFWPLGVLAIALPIFGLVLLGGAVVLVARGHRNEGLNFALAIILGASLVTTAVGFAQLLAPLFSSAFGRDFTYTTTIPPAPVPSPQAPGQEAPPASPSTAQQTAQTQLTTHVENQFRDDIVYGATMLVVGLLVFGVLQLGRWVLRRQQAESDVFGETYLLLMLITTSIVALAALVTAVAELLRRYVVVPVGAEAVRPHPGAALATALAFLPLWVWFLVRAIQALGWRSTRGGR